MMIKPFPQLLATTADWWVVSKPPGWLTIPGRNVPVETASSHILKAWLESETRKPAWVVHRLDRDTSGVVLFAASAQSHSKANQWFQTRKMKKVYHCLASGIPTRPILKIQTPIAGAPSVTQIEVKEKFRSSFLARVLPATGRRHQIRIHLSEQGFPILGDRQYGGSQQLELQRGPLLIERVALHASLLELPNGEKFEAPLPDDFLNWAGALRQDLKKD